MTCTHVSSYIMASYFSLLNTLKLHKLPIPFGGAVPVSSSLSFFFIFSPGFIFCPYTSSFVCFWFSLHLPSMLGGIKQSTAQDYFQNILGTFVQGSGRSWHKLLVFSFVLVFCPSLLRNCIMSATFTTLSSHWQPSSSCCYLLSHCLLIVVVPVVSFTACCCCIAIVACFGCCCCCVTIGSSCFVVIFGWF